MKKIFNKELQRIIFTSILFIVSLITQVEETSLALTVIAYVVISYEIYIHAINHLKEKKFFR